MFLNFFLADLRGDWTSSSDDDPSQDQRGTGWDHRGCGHPARSTGMYEKQERWNPRLHQLSLSFFLSISSFPLSLGLKCFSDFLLTILPCTWYHVLFMFTLHGTSMEGKFLSKLNLGLYFDSVSLGSTWKSFVLWRRTKSWSSYFEKNILPTLPLPYHNIISLHVCLIIPLSFCPSPSLSLSFSLSLFLSFFFLSLSLSHPFSFSLFLSLSLSLILWCLCWW